MSNQETLLAAISEELIADVSQKIFDFNEVMLEEVKSSSYLATLLEEEGFEVERGAAEMPTAFVARYRFSDEGPKLGLMAEYDSLGGLGHACGHNLIAAAAAGAAVALKNSGLPLNGSLVLYGTPGEEGAGGKVVMAAANYFDDIDAMVYFHPSSRDDLYGPSLACRIFQIVFQGKPAHVQLNPQDGRNALQALIKVFNGLDELGARYGEEVRIGGIIKDGGHQSILVPERAEGEIWLSGLDDAILERLTADFTEMVPLIAKETDTQVTMNDIMHYSSVVQNLRLNQVIGEVMETLGLSPAPPALMMTSTDCGATSKRCPFAGFRLSMGDPSPVPHTHEFARVSGSSEGLARAVRAAQIYALVLLKLYQKPELLLPIQEEFRENFNR